MVMDSQAISGASNMAESLPEEEAKRQRRIKRKKKRSAATTSIDLIDDAKGINTGIGLMNSQLLADYIAQKTRYFHKDLSSLELEDKYVPASIIFDSTSWQKCRDLVNLPSFIKHFAIDAEGLGSAALRPGAPHTIVITAAGMRAADIARSLRVFQGATARIAKLFAKHIKLDEAIKLLESKRISIAVGTPLRLQELIRHGALSLSATQQIIVDASHVDQKRHGILELRETQGALVSLVIDELNKRLVIGEGGATRLLFY